MTDAKLPLPGMAAISLWMLALALIGVAGRADRPLPVWRSQGWHPDPVYCLCRRRPGTDPRAPLGMGAHPGRGLLLHVFRVLQPFPLSPGQWVVMVVINLVFFLYLVRPEVIGRLR